MDQPVKPKSPHRTTWILVGGFALLLLLIIGFSLRDAGNQDRLDDGTAEGLPDAEGSAAGCSGNRINANLKSALFAEAAASRPRA